MGTFHHRSEVGLTRPRVGSNCRAHGENGGFRRVEVADGPRLPSWKGKYCRGRPAKSTGQTLTSSVEPRRLPVRGPVARASNAPAAVSTERLVSVPEREAFDPSLRPAAVAAVVVWVRAKGADCSWVATAGAIAACTAGFTSGIGFCACVMGAMTIGFNCMLNR